MAKPLRQHQHRNHHRNKRVEASILEQNGTTAANKNKNINGSHNNNNATKVSSTASEELSPWSPWSKCNKRCRQNRQRKCIPSSDSEALKRCIQQHVLKQERTCRKGRCKRGGRAFHVVLPPKRESLKQPTTTTSSSASSTQNQQQSDVRVLLSLNSIFYSSWSRWSTCTKACTTTRYRTCRFQVVEEVFVHPDYDPETVDNDVALLRLPEAIKLGHQGIRLACLPQPGQSLPITQKCTIIGWGKERSSHVFGTEVLHEAEVPIVKTSACREVYEDYFITDNMFCAGYRKGRIDSCAGDSGGPLLCSVGDRWTIFGITSFGEGCGKRGKFGIYTKVPNYVSWIQRVIDLNGGI
ncbi:hypothetical protein GHT06_006215 [Daphnia sinensis]|nr:hypothetical protein GHT06_006215 [Daphnia sinensis]